MLTGKKIILGVCGGIAAYKTPFLVRELVTLGAEVQVVMTQSATQFVTPLTLATVSSREVLLDFGNNPDQPTNWNNHIKWADWADFLILAPTTLNTLSKLVSASCDNFLMAVYYSFQKKVLVCPAMDLEMYQHPATQKVISTIANYPKHHLIGPEFGFLSSGKKGKGRMSEPSEIVQKLTTMVSPPWLEGKQVLITAGPTYENIDPVRFIGNYSSGKMGFALTETALELGAKVVLISGPTHEKLSNNSNLKTILVTSTKEMYKAVEQNISRMDYGVFAAAVSDYRPADYFSEKIKKETVDLSTLKLTENPDILKTFAQRKSSNQTFVGFALETENAEENALKKLKFKGADFMVLNQPSDNSGFGTETNQVKLCSAKEIKSLPLDSKKNLALSLWKEILGKV